MRSFLFLFISICMFTTQALALTCSDIVKELASLTFFASSTFNSPNMASFQSAAWFSQTLGNPDNVIIETTYSWGNYSIVNRKGSDGSVTTFSTETIPSALLALKPANSGIFVPTVAQATQALGAPTDKKVTKSYSWNCKENPQNSIIVSVDASNNINNYSGNYNGTSYDITPNMIKMLNATYAGPKLNANTIGPYQDQQTISLIQKEFNITIQGHDQIQPAVTTILTNYYMALQNCTSGHYKYLMPVPFGIPPIQAGQEVPAALLPPPYIVVQATIQGFQGDKCIVKTSTVWPAVAPPYGTDMNYIQNCQIKKTDLAVFTPADAQFWAEGNIDTARPSAQVMSTSCIHSSTPPMPNKK